MNFSKAMKYVINTSGMSAASISRLCEVDQSFFSHINAGRKSPSWETIQKICDMTGISTFEFFVVAISDDISKLGKEKIRDKFVQAINFK